MKKKLFLFFILMFLFTGFVYADYEYETYSYKYKITGLSENGYIYMDSGEENKIEIAIFKKSLYTDDEYEPVSISSCEKFLDYGNITTYLEDNKCYLYANDITLFNVQLAYDTDIQYLTIDGEAGYKLNDVDIPKDGVIYLDDLSNYEINPNIKELFHSCSYKDLETGIWHSDDFTEHGCTLTGFEHTKRYEVEIFYGNGNLRFIIDTGYEEYINYVVNNKLHDVEVRYTDFIDYRNHNKSFGISNLYFIDQCSVSEDLSFSCPISYYINNKNVKDTFYGKLKGLTRYNFMNMNNNEVGINSTSYLSFYNYKSSDLYCFAEDTSIAKVDDCVLTGLREGKTNVIVFDRKSLDYIVIPYKVVNYDLGIYHSSDYYNFMNQFNNPVSVNLDNLTYNLPIMFGTISANDVLSSYIRSTFPNAYVSNISCLDGKCSFDIALNVDSVYVNESYGPFEFSYYGIEGYDPISLNVGSEYVFTQSFQLLSTDTEDEFTISNYDPSMIEVDGNKMTGLKVGITEVTITGTHSGYTASFKVNIFPKYEDIDALNNYLFSSVNLEYNKDDFKDNLDVLGSIIENKKSNLPDNISYLNNYLNYSVECINTGICSVYYELKYFNNEDINQYGSKNIRINYTGGDNGLSVLKSKLNKTNEIIVSFDDYIKYMYECEGNSTCYYDKLKGLIDLSEFNKDEFTVSISSENYYNKPNSNVFGSFYEDVIISYKGSTLFAKRILVRVDNLLTIPVNTNVNSEYVINEIKGILGVDNFTINNSSKNVYYVDFGTFGFNILVDKPSSVKALSVNPKKNFYVLDNIGDEVTVDFSIYPENYTIDPVITMESLDESVVRVDDNKLIAVGSGVTLVKVKVSGTSYYCSSTIKVFVDTDVNDYLDSIASSLNNHVKIPYEYGSSELVNAISSLLLSSNWNEEYSGLSVAVYEDSGKYYFNVKMMDYSVYPTIEYSSSSKEVTYEYVGIKVKDNALYLKTGDEVDTELFFSEGSNRNLYSRSSHEDVATLDVNTGILKALNPGYTYIYITDKKNAYYNRIEVFVDYDDFFSDYLDEAISHVVSVIPQDYSSMYDTQPVYKWESEVGLYDYGAHTYNSRCDKDKKECEITISLGDDKMYGPFTISYVENGIAFKENEFEINIDGEYELEYVSTSDDKEFINLTEDICSLDNETVKGLKSGLCVIVGKTNDSDADSISIIVDKNGMIAELDDLYDSLPDSLTFNNTYGELYGSDETIDFANVIIQKKIREAAGLDDSYYVSFEGSMSEEDKKIKIILGRNYTIDNPIYDVYGYTDANSTKTKEIQLIFNEETSDTGEHVEDIVELISEKGSTYNLSIYECFSYLEDKMAGKNVSFSNYSSEFKNDILQYPGYSYVIDLRMGSGMSRNDDYIEMMEGGMIHILYNDSYVYTIEQVTFNLKYEVSKTRSVSQDEFILELEEDIKNEYLTYIGKKTSYSLRSSTPKVFKNIAGVIDEIDVVVSYDSADEKGEKYKVNINDDIKFIVNVNRNDDSDYVYDITKINIPVKSYELKKGETKLINYSLSPSQASSDDLVWKSNNNNVVTVNKGSISAVGSGSTTIEVSSYDGKVNEIINVKVSSINKGDINQDGKVNINDLVLMRKHLAQIEILSGDKLEAFDVNGDGKYNINDVVKMRKYLAGLESL